VGATLFADEIIRFVLGANWVESVPVFKLLAPAALIGALLNPLGWMFISSGRADRQLKAGLVWCPLLLAAFALGLPYCPTGVAIGYSIISAILAIPLCLYALHGTTVRISDLGKALVRPVIAAILAGSLLWLLKRALPTDLPVGVVAIGGCAAMVGLYAFFL